LKVRFHHFSKKSSRSRFLCFMIEAVLRIIAAQKHVDPVDPDPQHWIEGFRSGSVPLTNGSGSKRPKNIRILRSRIRNTAPYTVPLAINREFFSQILTFFSVKKVILNSLYLSLVRTLADEFSDKSFSERETRGFCLASSLVLD
jgi:hypothetical protein